MLAASSGCYGYFNADPATLHPGEQVRVVLNNEVADHLSPAAMLSNQEVDGDFAGLTPDSLKLSVWIGQQYQGTGFSNAHQTVSIPRTSMQTVLQRRLSKVRTGLVVAGIVAGVAWVTRQIAFTPDANPPGGTTPPPPPGGGSGALVQIPLLRLPCAISW